MTSHVDANRAPVHRQLSYAEQLMWQAEHGPSSLPFLECPRHLALAVRVVGRLDVTALHRTVIDIVGRHDALRSRFVERDGHVACLSSGDVEPLFTITAVDGATPATVSPDDAPHDDPLAVEQALLRDDVNRPFSLHDGGLLRVRIFALTASRSLLVVTLHHIVGDGWSLRLLARELQTGYASHVIGQRPSWPPLPAGYADYVAWQQERLRSARAHELAATWAEEMTEVPATVIQGDRAPQGAVTRAARHSFTIPADLVERLRGLAAAHRVTVGIAALASFIVLVAHASRRSTVTIGVPVWDRSRPAFEELIGLFMNALPLRVKVPPHPTPLGVLAETRDRFRRLSQFSSLPYPWLREQQLDRGVPAADPFRIVFNFAAIHGVGLDLPGVTSEPIEVLADTPAVADLSLHIFARGQSFAGVFLYKEEMYSPAFVASLGARYTRLLGEAVIRSQ
jgi:hypothetical protein